MLARDGGVRGGGEGEVDELETFSAAVNGWCVAKITVPPTSCHH